MLAYYGFFSVLPLFLVLVTVLGIVLQGNPRLQESILNSALAQFPVIGDQLQTNIKAINGNWVALIVGIAGALWGGLGVMQAIQSAMNEVWRVPKQRRPNYLFSRMRSLLMLAVLGGMLLASIFLSSAVSFIHSFAIAVRVLSLAGSYVLAVGVFLLAYRVLTAQRLSWRDVLPGAAASGLAWVMLQTLGAYFLNHQIKHATSLYGYFGFTIGLLLMIYLASEIALYGAEINSVLKYRRWPRALQGQQALRDVELRS